METPCAAPCEGRRWRRALLSVPGLALAGALAVGAGALATPDSKAGGGPRPTIVLVHGDWADASSWTHVIERLQKRGFTVTAPPNLLRGPATDAPYLASYLRTISGPIVLVAHSYGGFVATNAATGIANVKARVSSCAVCSWSLKSRLAWYLASLRCVLCLVARMATAG